MNILTNKMKFKNKMNKNIFYKLKNFKTNQNKLKKNSINIKYNKRQFFENRISFYLTINTTANQHTILSSYN